MSSYSPIFSIDVEHAFRTQATDAFSCVPTPETLDWIRRRDLLLRPQRNGVALFCEDARRNLLLENLEPGAAVLGFKWFARDPLFSQYTLPVLARDKLLFVRSATSVAVAVAGQGDRRYLHGGASIDADTDAVVAMTDPLLLRHLDRGDALKKPALVVQIDLADQVADSDAGIDYVVRFAVRKSVWKYYLISGAGAEADTNTDTSADGDGDGDRDDNGDANNDAWSGKLAVIDLDDKVRFLAGAPEPLPGNRRALVFISENEIDMQQNYPQRFQLREQGEMGERILMRRLPNADVGRVTQEILGSRVALVSEIYIN
jgi:hypothetical protein